MSRSNCELNAQPRGGFQRETIIQRKAIADVLVAKAAEIATLNFHIEQLAATVCLMREEIADLRVENGTLSCTIHDLRNPPPSPEPETESWQRLYADYRRYRRQVGYPQSKKGYT